MAENDLDTAVQDDGAIATDPSRCPGFCAGHAGLSRPSPRSSGRARRVRMGGTAGTRTPAGRDGPGSPLSELAGGHVREAEFHAILWARPDAEKYLVPLLFQTAFPQAAGLRGT